MLAKPMRNVAVLVPSQTRDWDTTITMPESPFGIAQTLEELHIPYQMLGENSLTEQILAQFKVLFVGSASALSEEQLASILAFAKRGGTVMLDTTAATRNQIGERHKKWPLAEIFGFNQPGRIGRASGKAVLLTKKEKFHFLELVSIMQRNLNQRCLQEKLPSKLNSKTEQNFQA